MRLLLAPKSIVLTSTSLRRAIESASKLQRSAFGSDALGELQAKAQKKAHALQSRLKQTVWDTGANEDEKEGVGSEALMFDPLGVGPAAPEVREYLHTRRLCMKFY